MPLMYVKQYAGAERFLTQIKENPLGRGTMQATRDSSCLYPTRRAT